MVHHDRMIDNEISGRKRVHPVRIAVQIRYRLAHGGEIHHCGNPGEVLHQDAGRGKRNLSFTSAPGLPSCERFDIVGGHVDPVFGSQKIFQENFQCHRQTAEVKTWLEGIERAYLITLAVNIQGDS